jgi:1,4-dihydroxy-2-naphthoate octaprenyltransferase
LSETVRKASSILYGILLALAYLSIIAGVLSTLLPTFCLIALLTVFLASRAYQGTRQNAENIPALIPSMGMNVIINLSTPILLAIGLFLG